MKKKLFMIISTMTLISSILVGCQERMEVKPLTDEDIKTYTMQMQEDPLSGDITLNGQKLTLPIDVKELQDMKFSFNDYADKGQDLEDGYYVEGIVLDDGTKSENTRIEVIIYNTSGNTVKFDNGKVGEIEVYNSGDSYKNTIVLPKGITLKSTYDDVINAYGKPTVDYFKEAGRVTYTKSDDEAIGEYGQELEINFDMNTKVIKSISLKSIV